MRLAIDIVFGVMVVAYVVLGCAGGLLYLIGLVW